MVPAPLLSLQATEFSVSPALPCLGPNWKPASAGPPSTVQAPTIGTPACSHSFWKSRIIAEGCTRCGMPYHDCENPFLRRGTGWKISTGSCRQGELTHRDFRRRVPFRGIHGHYSCRSENTRPAEIGHQDNRHQPTITVVLAKYRTCSHHPHLSHGDP